MEKRPPLTRKAFQPSRSRLLQPSQLFKSSPAHADQDKQDAPASQPLPSQAPAPSNPPPNFPKPATPFIANKSPNPARFTPFLSNTNPKQTAFPLRSANQPILKSNNQPATQKQHGPKPHSSSQPLTSKTKTHESNNVNTTSPTPAPEQQQQAQQQPIPFPLSTLPPHVLQSMSQKERDAYKLGWSAGWEACDQHKRNTQKHHSTFTTSSTPSNLLSPPPKSPPDRSRPIRPNFPDPYAMDQPGKNPTVGASKRPRTSPVTNSNTRISHVSPNVTANKPRSSPHASKPQSMPAPRPQSAPSIHQQNGNADPRKRVSGLDAYLARGKLPVQSAHVSFAAATTSGPVGYQRKKRKRSSDVPSPPRRPPEARPRPEPRRPETRTRQANRRPVEIRSSSQPPCATSMNVTSGNAKAPSWLKNGRSGGNGRVRVPAVPPMGDPPQKSDTPATKQFTTPSAQPAQPTTAHTNVPVRQNSVGMGKQILTQLALEHSSRCDLDRVRRSQESQEESGWGSALNAATTRELIPTTSTNGTNAAKQTNIPRNPSAKPPEPPTASERDPRRRKRVEKTVETDADREANRLAEKERDEIAVQAYAERFGLVIVERDRESGKVEWVACKFCPVFGCRTRDADYIMAHRAPFSSKKFVTHLEKDHCVKWNEYKQANAEEKGEFFSGKVLPAKAFHDRIAELKRSQDGMARRRVTPGVTAEEENANIDKAIANLAKQQVPQKVSSLVMDTTDDCWIGRKRFRNRILGSGISVCQVRRASGTNDELPSLERIRKCIKEVEINSDIAGFILHGVVRESTEVEWADNDLGFTDTIVLEGEEMRPTTLIFSNVDKVTASRAAFVLRHLHRGMAGCNCIDLLRDTPEIQADGSTGNDGGREMLGHANALMALGMHILTRALISNWRNWAVGLTTRSCRYVKGGAVEVQISMHDDGGEMRKAHLITVQDVKGGGAAVVEALDVILPSWKQRLLGVHSGICKRTQTSEKEIEAAILTDVRNLTGRELLLVEHNITREDNPVFPWGLSKMCESKFDALVSSIEGPLGLALGKARLRAAKTQRDDLFKRVMNAGGERAAFREAWNIAGERAADIFVVAEGLRSIWVCDCEEDGKQVTMGQRREQGVVDCDAERVLWARELVRLWKWCGRVVTELGLETP